MILRPPYVVVVTAPSSGVGKSTLAGNLVVYLKALNEELPVAYASFDAQANVGEMFALSSGIAAPLSDLQQGIPFEKLLTFGEFGVEFCAPPQVGCAADVPTWLRKGLAQADYDGILLLDVSSDHPLLRAALWAADMVLLPVKDPAVLSRVVDLKKAFIAGGGRAEQLWLLPSGLGEGSRYRQVAGLKEFLRFAAEERGFQVLDEEFVADSQVCEQAVQLAKPVLTRVPQSPLHQHLRQLAGLILQQRQQGDFFPTRVARWLDDQQLPSRARRIALLCPFCQRPVVTGRAHYLEVFPARRRLLLHADCFVALLRGTATGAFYGDSGGLLIQPAIASGGLSGQLKLLVFDRQFEPLNSETISVVEKSAWAKLIYKSTGRWLAELYQENLLVSEAVPVEKILSDQWYKHFTVVRKRLRQQCREEKI